MLDVVPIIQILVYLKLDRFLYFLLFFTISFISNFFGILLLILYRLIIFIYLHFKFTLKFILCIKFNLNSIFTYICSNTIQILSKN